jgi:hypothetical protein
MFRVCLAFQKKPAAYVCICNPHSTQFREPQPRSMSDGRIPEWLASTEESAIRMDAVALDKKKVLRSHPGSLVVS